MKILNKVPGIEVKRCFVVSDLCAARTHRGHMKKAESPEHYLKSYRIARIKAEKMNEKTLDSFIGGKDPHRLAVYNSCLWCLALITPEESAVWKRAGELPLRWTNRSLAETAEKVKRALGRKNGFSNKRIRAAHAVRGILETSISIISKERYLLPIALKGGTDPRVRRRLKMKMKADIDDGCMRSVALAVAGVKLLKMYYGVAK